MSRSLLSCVEATYSFWSLCGVSPGGYMEEALFWAFICPGISGDQAEPLRFLPLLQLSGLQWSCYGAFVEGSPGPLCARLSLGPPTYLDRISLGRAHHSVPPL
ncbi:UNVERIFIED_CONTAM: hypothetical protein Slati_4214200 [Sesamum latifolium]|uniref:Uncharacterized protein n=1 Tax=Sesamum latifolium TaxID=2727402 RepID=A0AAW2TBE1_9LAMI